MFREIPDLPSPAQVAELRRITAGARFVDGRISNPHSTLNNNLQLDDAVLPSWRNAASAGGLQRT